MSPSPLVLAEPGEADLGRSAAMPQRHWLAPGTMVGEYRVERLLAHGGMSTVFAGEHPVIRKRVAIKLLHHIYPSDSEQVARFELEARAVNQIGHHNLVDIFAIGELPDGRRFMVMELLDGLELHQLLGRVGRFRPGELLPIYEQLCDALAATHAKGFIHRDIKPENVAVLRRFPRPFIKILDFGIAKLRGTEQTAVGIVLGTPEYMAPEQCRSGPVDARADIYALGVMCYELVTGHKPFNDEDPLVLLSRQLHEEPPPPTRLAPISAQLERVILRAMAKDPARRQQSVGELIAELRRAIPQPLPWTASLDDIPPALPEQPPRAIDREEGPASTEAARAATGPTPTAVDFPVAGDEPGSATSASERGQTWRLHGLALPAAQAPVAPRLRVVPATTPAPPLRSDTWPPEGPVTDAGRTITQPDAAALALEETDTSPRLRATASGVAATATDPALEAEGPRAAADPAARRTHDTQPDGIPTPPPAGPGAAAAPPRADDDLDPQRWYSPELVTHRVWRQRSRAARRRSGAARWHDTILILATIGAGATIGALLYWAFVP